MKDVQFLKSAVDPKDYPDESRPEIAMVGRSNAGKSTLLNAMVGAQIAKVSATPGKTRLVNFFNVGRFYRLVDLPGYGYAARDKAERAMWAQMIEAYFKTRPNLAGLILVCDMRREWNDEEEQILEIAGGRGVPVACALTKMDKLNHKESIEALKRWMATSEQIKEFFHPVSALKKDGVEDLEDYIFKTWIKPKVGKG